VTGAATTTVAVYVCTYQRNGPLRTLLASMVEAAAAVAPRVRVGLVVVDDNPDGRAREVADEFEGRFGAGVHYRHVGSRNIAIARNVGLEAGVEVGDWVAMTDDDCEVSPQWLAALLDVQERTGAEVVTGPLEHRLPPEAPAWLRDQPFSTAGLWSAPDGAIVEKAQTHNSMISSAWLRAHPEVRFDPKLGTLGGEDMDFYRRARAEGLTIAWSAGAVVHAVEPLDRTTFRFVVGRFYWLGNTEYVTNHVAGVAPARLFVRGARHALASALRPFARLLRGSSPQWRYAAARLAQYGGLMAGAFGVRVAHH
jgi:glycosyltransferase involved in cell wall biosynthesis